MTEDKYEELEALNKDVANVVKGWTAHGTDVRGKTLWMTTDGFVGSLPPWSTDDELALMTLQELCEKNSVNWVLGRSGDSVFCSLPTKFGSINTITFYSSTTAEAICTCMVEWCKFCKPRIKDNNVRMEGGYQQKTETAKNPPTGGSNVVPMPDTELVKTVRDLDKRVEKLEGLNKTPLDVRNELDSIIANIHKIYERVSSLELLWSKNEALELLKRVKELEAYHTPLNSSAHSTHCR